MTPALRSLTALAAALAPLRAEQLMRYVVAAGADVRGLAAQLAARPRAERLAALRTALPLEPLEPPSEHPPLAARLMRERRSRCAPASVGRTLEEAHRSLHGRLAVDLQLGTRRGEARSAMTWPFALPPLSRGYAALKPPARAAGCAAVRRIAPALSDVLGLEIAIEGRPLPARPARTAGVARLGLALEALPSAAWLEVEIGLLARTLERVSGTAPRTPAGTAVRDAELRLLELVALVAIDGARCPELDSLGPRLVQGEPAPVAGGLAVHLELRVGDDRGRGRLVIPADAVAALGQPAGAVPPAAASAELMLPASFRSGTCSIAEAELSSLALGDVLLLDEGPARSHLVFPGGLAFHGELEGDRFLVKEVQMTEAQADYPIALSVEIARVTVRLGDLAQLEPGAALPLAVAPEGAVVLRAGERAVARGQLIDLEGSLGVRVTQIGGLP
jgi:type III secretion system YscQ/HrcQ family protein